MGFLKNIFNKNKQPQTKMEFLLNGLDRITDKDKIVDIFRQIEQILNNSSVTSSDNNCFVKYEDKLFGSLSYDIDEIKLKIKLLAETNQFKPQKDYLKKKLYLETKQKVLVKTKLAEIKKVLPTHQGEFAEDKPSRYDMDSPENSWIGIQLNHPELAWRGVYTKVRQMPHAYTVHGLKGQCIVEPCTEYKDSEKSARVPFGFITKGNTWVMQKNKEQEAREFLKDNPNLLDEIRQQSTLIGKCETLQEGDPSQNSAFGIKSKKKAEKPKKQTPQFTKNKKTSKKIGRSKSNIDNTKQTRREAGEGLPCSTEHPPLNGAWGSTRIEDTSIRKIFKKNTKTPEEIGRPKSIRVSPTCSSPKEGLGSNLKKKTNPTSKIDKSPHQLADEYIDKISKGRKNNPHKFYKRVFPLKKDIRRLRAEGKTMEEIAPQTWYIPCYYW